MPRRIFVYICLFAALPAAVVLYLAKLNSETHAIKTALLRGSEIHIYGEMLDSAGKRIHIDTVKTNTAQLRDIVELIFDTKNSSVLIHSPHQSNELVGSVLNLTFEVRSNNSLGTIRIIGATQVIVNESVSWRVPDNVDLYGNLQPLLR
jgi:hypothetical protein